ncbi:MAG: type VI secretion system contractile sheath large subunit [Planctomycetales bacterium]|nr:type VI secretion system contractile sheath large subunit [Planctomycetales bacterium]
MSKPLSFDFHFSQTPGAQEREPQQPLRMLVIGNFSGRSTTELAAAASPLAQRKIQRVDVDNFEDLLAQKKPRLMLPLGQPDELNLEIEFRELEDFHPDQLLERLAIFQQLRDLRQQLQNPQTFAEAAKQLRKTLPDSPAEATAPASPPATPSPSKESNAETLQRILGNSVSVPEPAAGGSAAVDVRRLIEEIVAPYVLPGADPRQEEYLQCLDAAVTAQLRAILHHEAFQSLESSWRGLHFLVSQVAMAEEVQVSLWDVTQDELQSALATDSGQLQDSLLYQRLVVEREHAPWSLMVSELSFGAQEADLRLLAGLGAIASQAGGPLLASAAPSLLGHEAWTANLQSPPSPGAARQADEKAPPADGESDNWQALRASPLAPWIGLAAPRFLLRRPYGAASDPLEAFPFEELQDPANQHAGYLWGAPALFCATLLGTAFLDRQWQMTPNDRLELGELPAVTFTVDGEVQLKACAEAYLSERQAESLLAAGIMPLLSFKNRNAIRVPRFQSIAEPLAALAGPWA